MCVCAVRLYARGAYNNTHTYIHTYIQDNIKIPKDDEDNPKAEKPKAEKGHKDAHHAGEDEIGRTDSGGKKHTHPHKHGPSFRNRLMSALQLNPVIPGAKGLQGYVIYVCIFCVRVYMCVCV